MSEPRETPEWERQWDQRLRLLEVEFGVCSGVVGHALVPLELGPEAGGAADVLHFKAWKPGVLSVTADLIGHESQVRNSLGWYELAICHRNEEAWGPNLISKLANYTLESALEPGETMDIGPAAPRGSTLKAFLFVELCRFRFQSEPAGVLLCIGITREELAVCRSEGSDRLLQKMRDGGTFPYTDFRREPVVGKKKRWGLF